MIKRRNFGKLKDVVDMPGLLDLQLRSFEEFLQQATPRSKRKDRGLQEVFSETFPIESYDAECKLEFVSYSIDRPKYTPLECLKKDLTYASPLKVTLRLRSKKETKEQEVYFGELPIMTETGTFIINGDERVIVSQLHRSPGISFEEELQPNGKKIFSARLIPYRGAWVEFEFDAYGILHVTIDRRRKILSTIFLRAIGLGSDEDIFKTFCGIEEVKIENKFDLKALMDRVTARDIVDQESKQLILPKRHRLTKDVIDRIAEYEIDKVAVLKEEIPELLATLEKDHTKSQDDALLDLFRRIRPGDPVTIENAKALLFRLFFDPKRYDLGRVGRHILNRKLKMPAGVGQRVLDKDTIVHAISALIKLKNGHGQVDDIDHLGNRRVRTIGELLQNQFRIGLVRMERSTKERMAIYDLENALPHNLINSKLVSSVIRDFFGRSQLSQFMDQTNPLAEMTHKRRLSALGPGGLSRERAGFEVRDVHHSHYGRICPIETPEGPNIGLIASLSTYARVNDFGFIETAYRRVKGGRLTDSIDYLSADVEDQYTIAQANASVDEKGRFLDKYMSCRHKGDFPTLPEDKIDYMDVSPKQLVSVAASLIPFLEHDDANRALMGSNMQRQAVPLLFPEAPLVGTGMEHKTAKDSGAVIVAQSSGTVKSVQADEIVAGDRVYALRKFMRSNASTCINQRPIVAVGDKINKGDVIADGAATSNGELALGRNVLVAFMPWRGYNFEDAILISEKLVKEDAFTSVHIEEFQIEARETRLGNEEITRDIPNVSEEALKNLDRDGVVSIGAEVVPGDILVGKVTPKSEAELSPEERLLRAIFGEKAGDVRDASLTVPPGVEGIVVDVQIFSKKGKGKTKEELKLEFDRIDEVRKHYESQIKVIKVEKQEKLEKLLLGKRLAVGLLDDETGAQLLPHNKVIRKGDLKKLSQCDLDNIKLADNPQAEEEIRHVIRILDSQMDDLSYELSREIEKIKTGDELPPGVLKKVVVHVASKRKISVGDKVAGRHGNKGVIAKIAPEEDMPYMPDGTSVEIVLNPLGVPSRMNVGQILETHLGWAAQALGFHAITPVFDGAKESEIKDVMKEAGLTQDGKIVLRDAFSGDRFSERVTVGYIYMMKLIHLVDDKIHARSIGPYSLVTQQPLGGKAQFGGQRFGEMEVWALEAYGAAYTLQELLTVKSDDVLGRTRIYESIVKGENTLMPGTPESLNVLMKELQGLALDVRQEKKKE